MSAARSKVPSTSFRRDGWHGEFVAGSPLLQWLQAGGRPDRIGSPSDLLVRDGSRSQCYRIEQFDQHASRLEAPMFFKVYRIRPGIEAWIKRRIGWHRTSWAWRLGWHIHHLGINVARPWGYLVPDPWRIGKHSYYWTEWIEGASHARKLVQSEAGRQRLTSQTWFALRVADMLARLHNAGVYHRDMNWGNLMVKDDCEDVWLIDLDSAHRFSLKPHTAACRDVARFLMEASENETSETWQACFMDRYASQRQLQVQRLKRDVSVVMNMFYRRRKKKLSTLADLSE